MFPGMLLTYFLCDFEIAPVAPIITRNTFAFTFHMRCISTVRSLYFRILSASFLITFLSPEIATSINIHVPFSLSRIIMSGLLMGIVLPVCTCWFHYMVTLPPWLHYYYLLQLSCHSVAVTLTIVTNKETYIKETIQKHSKYKHMYYQNTHTLQNPHIHTSTHTHTHTHTHITKPTHTHIIKPIYTHTLQNPIIHTSTHY